MSDYSYCVITEDPPRPRVGVLLWLWSWVRPVYGWTRGKALSVYSGETTALEEIKSVTRRSGWWLDKNSRRLLRRGDQVTLCRKVQGRWRPDGSVEPLVRLAEVEVVDVRRESLELLAYPDPDTSEWGYAWAEVEREGFPNMGPAYFVHRYFVDAQGIDPSDDVTRIEWRYLEEDPL